jgi:hypothetical protein
MDARCRNAYEKFSLASLVFHKFTPLIPALAFQHRRGQAGTASHRLVRKCSAMHMVHLNL